MFSRLDQIFQGGILDGVNDGSAPYRAQNWSGTASQSAAQHRVTENPDGSGCAVRRHGFTQQDQVLLE
ncbi:hypothetical protein LNQ03_07845 [Klebsiella pneumoniae subsp. pneumoniae]|nr:hypothetical protein [Klebsiella pneumoniae subsp. pneumoniae]